MSELKAYIAPTPDGTGLADYYLKSEVDKVIADLEESHKMEVEQLLMEIVDLKAKLEAVNELVKESKELLKESQKMHKRCADNAIKQLRHHKYKRCFVMARWCMTVYIHSKGLDFTNTEQWYWRRWHIRWRNLAEKFKEAK